MARRADHHKPLLGTPSPTSPLYQYNSVLLYTPSTPGSDNSTVGTPLVTHNGFLFPSSNQTNDTLPPLLTPTQSHIHTTNILSSKQTSHNHLHNGNRHDLKLDINVSHRRRPAVSNCCDHKSYISSDTQLNCCPGNTAAESTLICPDVAELNISHNSTAANQGELITELNKNSSVQQLSENPIVVNQQQQQQAQTTPPLIGSKTSSKLHGILKPPSAPKIVVNQESSSMLPPHDCIGRRRPPIGEKCFALLMFFLVGGIIITSFGATCIIPIGDLDERTYCNTIGGLVTALVLVSGGGILILLGVISCILIKECSGQELHGGKCHINCHIFEDLVE